MARVQARGFANLGEDLKSDRVAREIERRILLGELEPGDRLPTEGELGQMLGVSRSVIRDAVRILLTRGLVTVRQGQGTTVAAPRDEVFSHALVVLLARSDLTMGAVIEARQAAETSLLPLIVERGTEDDWAELERRLNDYAAAADDGDGDRAHQEHLGFHVALLGAMHLPALDVLLRPLHEIILTISRMVLMTTDDDWDVASHWPILEAVRVRDVEAGRVAMDRHFSVFTDDPKYSQFSEEPFREVFISTSGNYG